MNPTRIFVIIVLLVIIALLMGYIYDRVINLLWQRERSNIERDNPEYQLMPIVTEEPTMIGTQTQHHHIEPPADPVGPLARRVSELSSELARAHETIGDLKQRIRVLEAEVDCRPEPIPAVRQLRLNGPMTVPSIAAATGQSRDTVEDDLRRAAALDDNPVVHEGQKVNGQPIWYWSESGPAVPQSQTDWVELEELLAGAAGGAGDE